MSLFLRSWEGDLPTTESHIGHIDTASTLAGLGDHYSKLTPPPDWKVRAKPVRHGALLKKVSV